MIEMIEIIYFYIMLVAEILHELILGASIFVVIKKLTKRRVI